MQPYIFDDVLFQGVCIFERLLSKIKLRLQTVLENSTSVLLREIVCFWQGRVDKG